MATYDKYTLNMGPYQEGNVADIELDMDASFPMTGVDVTFEVRDSGNRLVIRKTSSAGGGIVITGQNIVISIDAADTKRRSGKYNYEIDFINADGYPFATIGGTFTINKEVNVS
jgi:hypothetical protein